MTYIIPNTLRMFLSVSILSVLCCGCWEDVESGKIDKHKFDGVRQAAMDLVRSTHVGMDMKTLKAKQRTMAAEWQLIEPDIRTETDEQLIFDNYRNALAAYSVSIHQWDIHLNHPQIRKTTREEHEKEMEDAWEYARMRIEENERELDKDR